jgi:hypothetical protein
MRRVLAAIPGARAKANRRLPVIEAYLDAFPLAAATAAKPLFAVAVGLYEG